MSVYAYVNNNKIIEFKQIDDSLYQHWVSSNNPKKDAYLIVVLSQPPVVSTNEIAEYDFAINANSVDQVWTIRNKTVEELRKTWTSYQFLLRFTQQERIAYRNAAKTDEMVADFLNLATAAQEIVNDDPMTLAGMSYLVQIGILTEQRKNEILDLI